MLNRNLQIAPISQADLIALDMLFKRIAERGRKIRTQNKPVDIGGIGEESISARQAIHKEQAKRSAVNDKT